MGNEAVLLKARLQQVKESTYPDLPQDEFFLLNSIDTLLKSHQMSYQQLEDGITDGFDDAGVDALYTFLNGALVQDGELLPKVGQSPQIVIEVIQAKNESGFGESALNTLISNAPIMFAYEGDDEVDRTLLNPKLRERLRLFRETILACSNSFPSVEFRIRYITRAEGEPHPKVAAKGEQLRKLIAAQQPQSTVAVMFLGAAQLNAAARDRVGQPATLRLSEGPIGGDLGGWVGLCALSEYLSFISTEAGALREEIFEENVRGFEGKTVINKGIMASLLGGVEGPDGNDPDFWWLNNGVTIIGSQVAPGGGRSLKIRDPQIVNGLQTSRSIYEASKDRTAFEHRNLHRNLLVRIIEAADEDLAIEIIKATNSQNVITGAALRATDPVQRAVEEYFLTRGYYYERKKNHYKTLNKPRSQIVELLEVAQAAAAIVLCEPHAARGAPLRLVTSDLTYKKIFSDHIPVEGLLTWVQVVRTMDDFLRARGFSRSDASNIKFHLARAVIAFYLHSSRPKWSALKGVSVDRVRRGPIGGVCEWLSAARERAVETSSRTDMTVVAKGPEWAQEIDRMLRQYSDKHRWPKQLTFG